MVRQRACVMAVLVGAALPPTLDAQSASKGWQVTQEVAGWFGSTWLSGARSPTVRSTTGGAVGVGVQRAIAPPLDAGLMVRAALQPISVREAGESRGRGALREANVLGTFSLLGGTRGRTEIRLEGMGGVAVLGGVGDILPFRDAASIVPVGEFGLAIARSRELTVGRRGRHYVGFARIGVLRLGASSSGDAAVRAGWVNRLAIGVRTGR